MSQKPENALDKNEKDNPIVFCFISIFQSQSTGNCTVLAVLPVFPSFPVR
jgi:hypothetical protein